MYMFSQSNNTRHVPCLLPAAEETWPNPSNLPLGHHRDCRTQSLQQPPQSSCWCMLGNWDEAWPDEFPQPNRFCRLLPNHQSLPRTANTCSQEGWSIWKSHLHNLNGEVQVEWHRLAAHLTEPWCRGWIWLKKAWIVQACDVLVFTMIGKLKLKGNLWLETWNWKEPWPVSEAARPQWVHSNSRNQWTQSFNRWSGVVVIGSANSWPRVAMYWENFLCPCAKPISISKSNLSDPARMSNSLSDGSDL